MEHNGPTKLQVFLTVYCFALQTDTTSVITKFTNGWWLLQAAAAL
jgi:hypothetical protein